jgi:hypothetical protein
VSGALRSTDSSDLVETAIVQHRFLNPPEKRWQVAWNWLSERANPIVVKEARQALNSRQFTLSFGLTLSAILFWTFYAVLSQLPEIYYLPGGLFLLSGYLVILSFPLLLVIPFSAYRSMMIESEERTFELVSISALSAVQIVNGKMFSACLQIAVYLSALTPCIVITYLLRGVSFSLLLNYLTWTILLSLVLTAASILSATASRVRWLQVFSSICVLAVLLITFLYWTILVSVSLSDGMINLGGQIRLTQFLAMVTIVAAVIPACLRCAAAAIDFPSENHAFSVRLRLLIAISVTTFWALWFTVDGESHQISMLLLFTMLAVFLCLGGLVAGEQGIISPRAQRTLPKTWLGRLFLTWFYPGAGLGYVFLTCLITGLVTPWILLGLFGPSFQLSIRYGESVAGIAIATWSSFVFYSGVTRLLMFAVSRRFHARVLIGLVIQLLLLVFGAMTAFFIALIASGFRDLDYSWIQVFNVMWTASDLASNGITNDNMPGLTVLSLLGLIVFVVNLLLCGRDVLLVRVGLPPRVKEEMGIPDNLAVPEPAPDPFS